MPNTDDYSKTKTFRERKTFQVPDEEQYKHKRAEPYKRECLDWQKLLEEEDNE